MRLILASESPRRRELLERAGFQTTVIPSKVSEIPDKNLIPSEQISTIARDKARAVFNRLDLAAEPPFVVLAADTEVVLDGETLGKPSSPAHAEEMLGRLSGRVHEVITSVWMIESSTGADVSHVETTRVFFRSLSPEEIRAYVATGEPMDKAGAYGIQSGGGRLVERIEGDFDNVVGLPVRAVVALFVKHGWAFS